MCDEQVINLQRTKVYVFSDFRNPPIERCTGTKIGLVQEHLKNTETLKRIDGEPMEFEWNIFPRFNTLQLSLEVKSLLLRLDETTENFTRKIIFMSMFNDISWGSRDNEKNVSKMLDSFFFLQEDLE